MDGIEREIKTMKSVHPIIFNTERPGLKARNVTARPEGPGIVYHKFQKPCKGEPIMSPSLVACELRRPFASGPATAASFYRLFPPLLV
jgi:hypothetical protein